LAIYSHPKYFEKGYYKSVSLFTAAPHLVAGKAHKKEEEEKQERLGKGKAQKKKNKSRRRGSSGTETRRSKKIIIRAARVPPVTKRRRIPQTQQKIAKIETSRACTRISQKKTEEK
jgi:hypothetical protein